VEITPGSTQSKATTGTDLRIQTTVVPAIEIFRHAGTLDAPTAVPGEFTIIRLGGGGYDGTDFHSSNLRIDFKTTTTWSASNQGSFMRFITTVDGATGLGERMRITSDGMIGIGTSDLQQKLHVSGVDMIIEDTTPFLSC
jgi:hypothetical protein